jgi:hypothetical protein
MSLSVAFELAPLPVGCPHQSLWYWKARPAPAFKKV